MNEHLPTNLQKRIERWENLSQWERAEVGRALRRLGLSYGEIMTLVPVPKSTLSNWVRGIELTSDQKASLIARTGSRRGVPRDTQRRRRDEVELLRAEAMRDVPSLAHDPLWVAGTVMYWAEGSKKGGRDLSIANSDPRAHRLFIRWVRAFHDERAEFVLKLNLHAGNDEPAARQFWKQSLGLENATFYKTFVKPDGTGHRKNHLAHGVCSIRMRRSADPFVRTMAWIDGLAQELTPNRCDSISPGR